MSLFKKSFLFTNLFFFIGKIVALSQNPVQLISSNRTESIIKISVKDFQKKEVEVNGLTELIIEAPFSTPILKKGSPDLPKHTVSLAIDHQAQMTYEIISSSYTDYSNTNIAPSKGTISRKFNPQDIPYEKGADYQTNAFFPSELVSLASPYVLRDITGQAVSFYPFQYNPQTKVLRVYNELVVKVYQKNEPKQAEQQRGVVSLNSEFLEIYNNQFLNFQSFMPGPILSEQGNMLIICHDGYMAAMAPFVAWKNQIGLSTSIVAISSIGNTSTNIKNYVSNYYNTEGLTYLLIVGDAQYVTPTYFANSGDSDNGYVYIVGNDKYPDAFVGRFSAETVQDVVTQVNKSINYEKNPTPGALWYKNGMGIASAQGPGDDGQMDFEHVRSIRSQLLGYTYSNISEMYDNSQGILDAPGDPSPAMIASDINNGLGIINYCGHGWDSGWGTSGFSSSDVSNLTNYNMLPFIISVACQNGKFNNFTCFAETWLRAAYNGTHTGAVAALMSTINQYWDQPMEGQDQMDTILIESYLNNIKRSFGGITFNGMIKMNDKYGGSGEDMTDTWTLFGDPSLVVRTNSASPMAVSHSTLEYVGISQLVVNCNKNGALVSLNLQGDIIGTGIVSSGSVIINFAPVNAIDSIDVTVTAYNSVPYIGKTYVVCPNPLLQVNTTNGNICVGDSILLSSTGATSYTWFPNTGLKFYSPSAVKVAPTITSNYTLTGTLNSVCFETVNITVNVHPLPNVTFNQAHANLCFNEPPVSLNGLPSGGQYYGGPFTGLGIISGSFHPIMAGLGGHNIVYTYTDANNCSNSASATLTVGVCTTLAELDSAPGFAVYPVPASHQITIKAAHGLKDMRLNIVNSLGQLIKTVEYKKGTDNLIIDTQLFTRGMYLLMVEGETTGVKFILE